MPALPIVLALSLGNPAGGTSLLIFEPTPGIAAKTHYATGAACERARVRLRRQMAKRERRVSPHAKAMRWIVEPACFPD